jgi:uncharacterized protein (DUF58 family)
MVFLRAYRWKVALLISAAFMHVFGGVKGSPKLVLEETRRDLGSLFAGERVTHTFTVRNEGTSALQLSEKTSQAAWLRQPNKRKGALLKQSFYALAVRAAPG